MIPILLSLVPLTMLTADDSAKTPPPTGDATAAISAKSPPPGWTSLFDGKSLNGWTPKIAGHALGEDPYNSLKVEDGLLRVGYDGYEGPYNGRFMHVFHDKGPFESYDLLVEYRFHGDQVQGGPGWAWRNSGAMLHCQDPKTMTKDQAFPVSIEGQFLGGDGTNQRPTMNLCTPGTHVVTNDTLDRRHCINSSSQTYHGDQWVTAVFKVRPDHVQHYVGDTLVLEYHNPQLDPNDADAGKIIAARASDGAASTDLAWNSGWISLQGESHPIDFKRVWIRPIKGHRASPDKAPPAPADDHS
ncbi:MAG: DUF1080 domain-containing protein [Phycisphaerales bacterium]|nr:DUF1080 domain-containing protein [Phycisphaerales bacterium]